ncbi:phenylacetic acid degradation protein [Roseovarius sp. HI0049]|nr:phenylacetic acid degradation protein [Roseovarius sp. HI0049]
MTPQMEEKIRESFDKQSMMTTLGARLARLKPGAVEVEAPILPTSLQQQGLAHGGLTFAIGDSAAGYSALSVMPEDAEIVTSELKINFLAPGKGDKLIARGKVIKPGRRLVIVQSDVYAVEDGHETHIAMLMGTAVAVKVAP